MKSWETNTWELNHTKPLSYFSLFKDATIYLDSTSFHKVHPGMLREVPMYAGHLLTALPSLSGPTNQFNSATLTPFSTKLNR